MDIVILFVVMGASMAFMVGIVIAIVMWNNTRVNRNCQQIAGELGLTFQRVPRKFLPQFGMPILDGVIHGRAVRIYSYQASSGTSTRPVCEIFLQLPNPRFLTFTISKRVALISGMVSMFTKGVVKTGDASFDDQMLVQSSDPQYFAAALIPELRQRIVETWVRGGLKGQLKLEGPHLKYAEQGTFSSAKICKRMTASTGMLLDMAMVAESYAATGRR